MDVENIDNWNQLRDLRNCTVGHPVGRRKFLNRNVIGYDKVSYSWWPKGKRFPKFKHINLASLIDNYEQESAAVSKTILTGIEQNCTSKNA